MNIVEAHTMKAMAVEELAKKMNDYVEFQAKFSGDLLNNPVIDHRRVIN